MKHDISTSDRSLSEIRTAQDSPLNCISEFNTSYRYFSGGQGLPGDPGHLVVTVMNLKDFSKQELTIMDRYGTV